LVLDLRERFLELRANEQQYLKNAGGLLAGVDEAGRGPLAGPVVAAAVVLRTDFHVEGVDDSKKLTASKRAHLYEEINSGALSVSWASVSERVVDDVGILNATYVAMREAIDALSARPALVMVDGRKIPSLDIPQVALPKADGKFLSVASASIIAKHVRDMFMADAHAKFPQYGFDNHKGYATKSHIQALLRHGPCSLHRFSFRPVKEVLFIRQASAR
jgi:ribonuclease HII